MGRAHAPAVRQAVHLRQSDAGTGLRQHGPYGRVVLGATRQLRAILQLAIRARLVRPRAARAGGAVRVPRHLGSDPPLARGPAHRHRDDAAHVHVHVRARLLSQLQVRLLAPPRGAAGGARGAPARLLLPGVVRAVGHLGRDGTRGRYRMGGRVVPRAPAERGAPLALRHATAGAGVDPAHRQPARRLAQERAAGSRFCLRPAAVGRALRSAGDGRRQRHLPAVVRAGGRGDSQRRDDRQPVAGEHRLVRAPAAAPSPDGVRLDHRRGGVSRPAVADADRQAHELQRPAAGCARAVLHVGIEARCEARQRRRHDPRHPRSADARPAVRRARRRHRAPGDQGSARQTADLLFTHRRPVRGSIRLHGASGRPGLRARAADQGARAVRQHQGGAVARLREPAAHDEAAVRRVSRGRGGATPPAGVAGQAVGRNPAAVRSDVLHDGAGAPGLE